MRIIDTLTRGTVGVLYVRRFYTKPINILFVADTTHTPWNLQKILILRVQALSSRRSGIADVPYEEKFPHLHKANYLNTLSALSLLYILAKI